MISSNPLFNNPFEASIQQLLRLEGRKKVQLQGEQKQLKIQQKALTDIDSKLSALNTLLTSFTESPGEKFKPLSGTSTNPDAVEIISTSGIKNPGSYSIDVNRLAKEDIVLSDAFVNNGTEISESGLADDFGSFQISLGDGDPVNINVDTVGLTNLEAMEAIADKVNEQLGEKVTASVFKLGDGTSRLSFKSVESGEANRINIGNEAGDFQALNLTNEYAAGELNAQFTIDSVTFERSSNLVTDAIEGFSFELNKTTESTEQLKITRNLEDARANIDEFIKKFNEANSIIREKTFLNGETGNRGPLQNERSVRNLSFSLRQAASLPIDSLAGNEINTLASIGIELERDGSMKVEDSEALDKALAENPQAVADLFSADDGIAAALNQRIDLYISDDSGVFDSIESGIEGRLDRLDDRIQNENEYLAREEESLRAEFAELQQIIDRGQRQFNNAVNFQSRLGF